MYLPAASLTGHVTTPPRWSPADSPAALSRTLASCDPSPIKYSVDDILQIILKSRKSWKTLKGQSEAVWPPYLEATMLKALQEYEPDDSRETRILGRYPMRNRFISDYIHNTTGKYRSAKQVGSRLQQLRDTPEGRDLIDVLTRCYHTRMDTTTQVPVRQPASWSPSSSPSVSAISSNSSSSSSPGPSAPPTTILMPRFIQPTTRQPPESRMPVYIDILPSTIYHRPSASTSSSSDVARHIRNIDPTVTFVSPSPVNGKSSYIVLLDGAPVHSEDTTLEYVGPYFSSPTGQSPSDEPILYNTALVPKYWDVICDAADPTLYTIVQDVFCITHPAPNQERPRPARIFSAIYHFQYPALPDSARSYAAQASAGAPSSSHMTSGFDQQTLQGPTQVDLTHVTSFAVPPTYANQTCEGEQTLFDEPFMLDVNFEQLAFDDFVVNSDNATEGTTSHFYHKDSNTWFM